jgi:hypothetical protein
MEVLPMTLGLVRKPDNLYAALEQLPESLNFTNLRLRARGLAYAIKICEKHLTKLTDRLIVFITERNGEGRPYRETVLRSFSGVEGQALEFITDHVAPLLDDKAKDVHTGAAWALGQIGGKPAEAALLVALQCERITMRESAAKALGKIGGERAVEVLVAAFQEEDIYMRKNAAEALGMIDEKALVNGLIRALKNKNNFVRQKAARIVGYYTTDKQELATLQHLAANDPAEEVRTAAREAAEKYANKLRYFAE